jgi:hypothetical protein
LLTESMVLGAAGAAFGLGLAYATIRYLAHQGSIALPLLSMVRVDGTVLGWTLVLAVGVAILFGTAPGLRMSSGNLQELLKDSGGHGASDGRKQGRLRSTLVITEIALACVLLVGAGLLLRSFLRVLDIDLGFEPSRAAAISLDFDDGEKPAARAAKWQEIVERTSLIPGVETAGISDNLPMSRNRSWGIAAKGEQKPNGRDFVPVFVYIVSPGYLKAMGMRLLEGRDITWHDIVDNRNVVIINETVARRLRPGRRPRTYSFCRRSRGAGDRCNRRCPRKQCRRQCRSTNVPARDETVWAGGRVSSTAFEAASHRHGEECDDHATTD